ncbi:MAG: tRNA (adenosine(37)-N6)-threonylcarbamoyltransferase complex ATPase subunit type 1 TsaE [Candidatus Omnitrophota bacterium]
MISRCVEETMEFGQGLAKRLGPGAVVGLFGGLGAGKTILVKGIARGLGISPRDVVSPSFALVNEYNGGRLPLYHFDLYRLRQEDISVLGFDEYLYGGGVNVIEWAERMGPDLPRGYLRIKIDVLDKEKRRISLDK